MRLGQRGFTLVEVLITTAVLGIFLTAVGLIVQTSMQALGEARLRSEATRLAQEKLELTRNLAYEDVGTVGGIPAGVIAETEIVRLHETDFEVKTAVLYIDDPFDEVAPTDLVPMDYKRVRVAVAWTGMFASKTPVVLMTDVSASGEETEENVGVLSIVVFNALGEPQSLASVSIESTGLDPEIDMEVLTDTEGKVVIPGAPVCTNCYRIMVTKPGQTEERTYSFSEVDNPTKPDVSIIRGQISEVSFAIDMPSSLIIRATRDGSANYLPFVGAQFRLFGTKLIGTTSEGEPVYKVDRLVTTATGGQVTVANLEWDQYWLELPAGSTVDIGGTWPFLPVSLLPTNGLQVNVVIKAASEHGLLVGAVDELNQPITQYQATLIGETTISTQSSGAVNQGDWSQVYYGSLSDALYELKLEYPGYATTSAIIDVYGDKKEYFILEFEEP